MSKSTHVVNITTAKPYKKSEPVPLIVKIQRPLSTNAKIPEYLIYNADRTIYEMVPENLNLKLMFSKGVNKIYRHILVSENGQVSIGEPADEQDW